MSTRTHRSLRGTLRGVLLTALVGGLLSAGAGASVAHDVGRAVGADVSSDVSQDESQGRAQRDGRAVAVSPDGLVWGQSLARPLFDPDLRWVPGDVRTAQFFVRNTKPESGDLSLMLEVPAHLTPLGPTSLTIAARAGQGAWVEVASGGRRQLIDGTEIAGQDAVRVQVRASLDPAAANSTMVSATEVDLTLTLTQAAVVADANSADDPRGAGGTDGPAGPGGPNGPSTPADPSTADGPGTGAGGAEGLLPDTGSPLRPWVLPFALLLLGAGAVLLARRREDDEPEELQGSLT